jgi:hypothetical protein
MVVKELTDDREDIFMKKAVNAGTAVPGGKTWTV